VLAILGILSVVGVSMLGNRKGTSVRELLDETEGALSNARVSAVASSRDVALDNWGTWAAATPAVIAYGDAALTDANIQTIANGLLISNPPNAALQYGATVAVPFHFMPNDVTQSRARVAVANSADWATAMTATGSGAQNQDITTLAPFVAGDVMSGVLVPGNNFFNVSTVTRQLVSGTNQRFTTTYFIEIVGTSPSEGPLPGSPMGLIVMMAGSASIYKFYNPGVLEGNGQWRRI
jgi:Tfp pilus assembly protein FimT